MKKLVAGTIVVLVGLALIYWQMREPAAAPAAAQATLPPRAPAPTTKTIELAAAASRVADAQKQAGKIDPASDAFIYRYDEAITPALTASAAKCYTGGLHRVHRNQKVKIGYTASIKDGVVSVSDVKIVESTINDKAMEGCFMREVAKVSWRDAELPDYLSKGETLVIRPERGMKKFTKENLDYDGEGPIGKLEDPGQNVTSSREQPKD